MEKKEILNYKKMLEDIDSVVNNDWGLDIDAKLGLDRKRGAKWTQKEADEMAEALMKVYRISHGVHNGCCAFMYKVK